VSLVKMDTLKNNVDALTKPVSTEKFSWCIETVGVARLDQWLSSNVASVERKQQVGECWVCVILLPQLPHT